MISNNILHIYIYTIGKFPILFQLDESPDFLNNSEVIVHWTSKNYSRFQVMEYILYINNLIISIPNKDIDNAIGSYKLNNTVISQGEEYQIAIAAVDFNQRFSENSSFIKFIYEGILCIQASYICIYCSFTFFSLLYSTKQGGQL